jgi:hypothetical protein
MAEIVTAADIENHLTAHNDFDLELAVYRHMKGRGIPAAHGGSYTDPQKGIIRQYDVRGTAIQAAGMCAVSMAIECKSLSETFPLIVSRVPREDSEAYHDVLMANLGGVNSTRVVPPPGRPSMYYRIGEYVGKKTSQIGVELNKKDQTRVTSDSDRETYDKWSQALASAQGLITEAFNTPRHRQISQVVATFVTAILVVSDGTLWTVDYDEAGTRAPPQPADEATLFVGREYLTPRPETYRIGHLQIFTKSGFFGFIDGLCMPTNNAWSQIFPIELFR